MLGRFALGHRGARGGHEVRARQSQAQHLGAGDRGDVDGAASLDGLSEDELDALLEGLLVREDNA